MQNRKFIVAEFMTVADMIYSRNTKILTYFTAEKGSKIKEEQYEEKNRIRITGKPYGNQHARRLWKQLRQLKQLRCRKHRRRHHLCIRYRSR